MTKLSLSVKEGINSVRVISQSYQIQKCYFFPRFSPKWKIDPNLYFSNRS